MLVAIKKFPALCVFALLTTAFLAFLGNWQYQKAYQQDLADLKKANNSMQQVIHLNNDYRLSQIEDGSAVSLAGRFVENKIIFHDNRLNLGKAGYHLLSIFKLDEGRSILVNRGWVAMNLDRRILPKVITDTARVTLKGLIRYPVKGVYTLGEETLNKQFPQRLQTINIDRLKEASGFDLEPFSVLLDSEVAGDHFVREWADLLPGKYMSADRHYAYSLQWYLLAIVGLIIFMILIRKMAKNEQE